MDQLTTLTEGFERGDIFVPSDGSPWIDAAPGIQVRVLRTCQVTGTWVVLYKVAAGTVAPGHVHFGAAESYLISGKMEVRGGAENGGLTICAGDYGYEANGARHDATYFLEDSVLFYMNHGPIIYYDEDGKVAMIQDFAALRQLGQSAAV